MQCYYDLIIGGWRRYTYSVRSVVHYSKLQKENSQCYNDNS